MPSSKPVISEMKEGDVYRWKWADEDARIKQVGYTSAYWCRSYIAVFQDGNLRDTYWSDGHYLDPSAVELDLLCNSQEWAAIGEWQKPYYASSDIIDTRHANNSNAPIYLRPGATRSTEAMLAFIAAKEADALSDVRMAQWCLDRCAENRAKIARGEIDDVSI